MKSPSSRSGPVALRRPCVCLLTLLSTGVVVHAQAQDGAPADTVVITASREAIDRSRVAGDVVVIDERRLRESLADSLEDVLRREAGVQISRNGGPGQNAALLLRGVGASGVVVLVDGVRVGSATLGQAAIEGLGLEQIERIEVLRGAASSLWGADALGGVIAITTKQGRAASRLQARVAVGTLASGEASLAASGRIGAVDLAASVSGERSRGVSAVVPGDAFGLHNPDRDGFARRSAHVKAGLSPAVGHRVGVSLLDASLNARYDGASFDPVTFESDARGDFRNRLHTRVASVDYRGPLASALVPPFSNAWSQRAQLSRSQDDLRSGADTVSRFRTLRDQLTWQHRWGFAEDGQLVAAIERTQEQVSASSFTQSLRRVVNAGVLALQGSVDGHRLQADVRHDRNRTFGRVTTARGGWRRAVGAGVDLRASAGTAFRAPSFNDLYFPGYGVTTLRPERGRQGELGLEWRAASVAGVPTPTEAALTLHRLDVRDLIGFQSDAASCPADPAYAFGCAGNVARARLEGVTLAGAHRVGPWRLSGTVDALSAKDRATHRTLPRRAREQASLRADWQQGDLGASVAWLHVGSRIEGTARLPAYDTLDLATRWGFAPAWQLEAKLLNAGDARVVPARDYQSPGRQAWIGVRYEGRGW
jgi:vitamin B12 transporter